MNIQQYARYQAFVKARADFMSEVYMWMMIGVLLTAVTALASATNDILIETLHSKMVFYTILGAELLFGFVFLKKVHTMSLSSARWFFSIYCVLSGLTLSVLLPFYKAPVLLSAFLTTIIAFGGLSLYGRLTKDDLSGLGNFCVMGLFGLVATGILGFIFPTIFGSTGMIIYNLVGVIVFAGLIAYDSQKLKDLCDSEIMKPQEERRNAIYGAFILYLDFVNLFLFILRLLSRRR